MNLWDWTALFWKKIFYVWKRDTLHTVANLTICIGKGFLLVNISKCLVKVLRKTNSVLGGSMTVMLAANTSEGASDAQIGFQSSTTQLVSLLVSNSK